MIVTKSSIFIAIGAISISAGNVNAATIGFEDFSFPGGNPLAVKSISETYQNLEWSGVGSNAGLAVWNVSPNDATDWYRGTRQPYARSGNNFAWNDGGLDLAITAIGNGSFDLQSFWVRSWPQDTFNVTARGYRNGIEIYTQPFTTTDTYTQISPNIAQIDRFAITLAEPQSLLFDDFTVSNVVMGSGTAVPEPFTIIGTLIGGTAAFRIRKKLKAIAD